MQTTEKKPPTLPPLVFETTPAGVLLVSCNGGRVKLNACPVTFKGRDLFKDWHEYSDTDKGREVRLQFHRVSVGLSWYDEDARRSERTRGTVSGVEVCGHVSAVYRQRWIGQDANGDPLRAWGWDYDHENSYKRRFGSAMLPPLPDGASDLLRLFAETVAAQAATPERLAEAERARFSELCALATERAEQARASAAEWDACANALSDSCVLAAKSAGSLMPADQTEAERKLANR